jgi:Domain of unknown function (DUF4440)
MKRLTALSLPLLVALMCLTLFAQAPQGGAPGAGGPGAGGGRGGGGGQGRGGGRGPAAAPPATGPVADATNKIIDAINKQDSAFFGKALTADALLADEDGHILPANIWIGKLTSSSKKIAITGLRVGELADGGWAVFNYTLDETAQGAPNQMKGSSSIVYKKNGADLQAVLIQLSVNGRAITPH